MPQDPYNPIEDNPCGICKANGLPLCKGHGKSGGLSSAGGGRPMLSGLSTTSNPINANSVYTSFQEADLWVHDEDELVFSWHNANSVMSIIADMGVGTISIFDRGGLSDANEKARDVLLTAIETEFNHFREELAGMGISVDGMCAIHEKNKLSIIIPNRMYYDAFMQRLIDKNLLITQAQPQFSSLQEPMITLEGIRRRANIPGIATAICDQGAVTTQSVGITNAETPLAVTDSTVFEAASLSKPVFAYIVLKLAQEGKINLDRPLHEYGHFGPESMREDENYKKLTARMMLSHQAGLPNEFNPPMIPFDYVHSAGERFDYSGEAYRFLGEVVEKISSTPLETLAQDAFVKMGMTHTSFMPPTGCSLIRLRDEHEPTPETVKELLDSQLDKRTHLKHAQLSIIYHKGKLFVAERAADDSIQITEKTSIQVGANAFEAIQARFASIPPFIWSTPIPIEARELFLATTIVGHSLDHAARLAIGHYQDGSINGRQRFYGVHPAGSLYTTASDYALFLNACISDSFIRQEMFNLALPSLANKDTKAIQKGVPTEVLEQISWGLGIGLQTNADGSQVAFHWGDNGTGRNLVAINLKTNKAIICLTNSANGPAAFCPIAEPVVGDLGPISQWLSKREDLPMEERLNVTQSSQEQKTLPKTDTKEQNVEEQSAECRLS